MTLSDFPDQQDIADRGTEVRIGSFSTRFSGSYLRDANLVESDRRGSCHVAGVSAGVSDLSMTDRRLLSFQRYFGPALATRVRGTARFADISRRRFGPLVSRKNGLSRAINRPSGSK